MVVECLTKLYLYPMVRKNYVVTGEDVNDFMVMENTAYLSYALRMLYHFLFEKGYSREKLNRLQLGLQEGNHTLIYYKKLMFTENFFVEMDYCCKNEKVKMKNRFYNSQKELCAEITQEVEWFDYNLGMVIPAPRQLVFSFSGD